MPEIFTNRQIPTIFFANCGDGSHRRFEDSAKFKFISAGQGKFEKQAPFYFSNQIRKLIIGDILAVYRNKIGFVGVARVISEPMTISNAYLGGQKVSNSMFSRLSNMFNDSDDPGFAECLVEIDWLTEIKMSSIEGSGWCYGGWTPQFVIGKLQETKYNCLQASLDISFDNLLQTSIEWLNNPNEIPVEDEEETFPEGKEMYELHKRKERSKELVRRAKENYFINDPKMKCQVCDISFLEKYGEIGKGFIEAHHTKPISELTEVTETRISDLVFVCSNCHRMLHRQRPWLSKDDLKLILR
jgi:HNH endonuclease